MKTVQKILTICLLLLFVATNSNAQLGIRAGANFAKVNSNEDAVVIKNNLGYHLGLVYQARIVDNIFFRPGLLYTLRGSKSEFLNVTRNTRTNYFEIPLDFQVKLGRAESNRLGLYAGPYIAFLVSAESDDTDVSDLYKGTDFGFNVGLTYDFLFFTVGVNYGAGLQNVADDVNFEDLEIRNQLISAFGVLQF